MTLTTTRPSFLDNSLIIAAHPDDELLWFNSILKDVDQVILVFEKYWPDQSVGPARRAVLENHPHPRISSLVLDEAATFGCADWSTPKISDHGLKLTRTARLRDMKQNVKRLIGQSQAPKGGISVHYRENFHTLYRSLKPILSGDMNVFTHNPWGEYGHEDHVQVFRALDRLRDEIGFKLWMSNYCTERSLPLAMTYFDETDHEWIELPTDPAYADEVAEVFKQSGCWTWKDDWKWFRTECFMEAPRSQAISGPQRNLLPLNMFNIT